MALRHAESTGARHRSRRGLRRPQKFMGKTAPHGASADTPAVRRRIAPIGPNLARRTRGNAAAGISAVPVFRKNAGGSEKLRPARSRHSARQRCGSFKSRFSDATEARACFYYSQLLDTLAVPTLITFEAAARKLIEGPDEGGQVPARALGLRDLPVFREAAADRPRHRALSGGAVSGVQRAPRTAALRVRAKGEAKALLERMIDDLSSDDEHVFAQNFYARKFDDAGRAPAPRCCAQAVRSSSTRSIAAISKRVSRASCGATASRSTTQRTCSGTLCSACCSGTSCSNRASCTAASTGCRNA